MSPIYYGLVPDLSQVAIIKFVKGDKRTANAYVSFPILDSPTGLVQMTGDDLAQVRRAMTPAQQRNLEEKLDFAVNSTTALLVKFPYKRRGEPAPDLRAPGPLTLGDLERAVKYLLKNSLYEPGALITALTNAVVSETAPTTNPESR